MKRLACTVCVLLGALTLTGCAGNGYAPYYGYGAGFGQHQRAIAGTAMGAAGGALLGGAMTQDSDGAVVGGLLGGAAGGLMGHSMDQAQRPQPYYGPPQSYYQGGYQQPQAYYGGGYPQPYYGGGHHHRHHHDDDD